MKKDPRTEKLSFQIARSHHDERRCLAHSKCISLRNFRTLAITKILKPSGAGREKKEKEKDRKGKER